MAPYSKKLKARDRGVRQRREAVTAAVMEILESSWSSKFEYEASCRHGLRSQMCLDGHSWLDADKIAGEIVTEALRRIGAVRPSWQEGQPEWTQYGHAPVERWQCENCGKPIPADRGGIHSRGAKFCSKECYGWAKSKRARAMRTSMSDAERAAMRAADARRRRDIADEVMTKVCEHCGEPFRAKLMRHRFCSRGCAARYHKPPAPPKRAPVFADRTCQQCGQTFRTDKPQKVFCSPSCKSNAMRAALASRLPLQQCPGCVQTFQPTRRGMVYCSTACSKSVARVYPPRPCESCGEPFQPQQADGRFCSPACFARARKTRVALAMPPKRCEQCGEEFRTHRPEARFCNRTCAGAARTGQPRGFRCEAVAS